MQKYKVRRGSLADATGGRVPKGKIGTFADNARTRQLLKFGDLAPTGQKPQPKPPVTPNSKEATNGNNPDV